MLTRRHDIRGKLKEPINSRYVALYNLTTSRCTPEPKHVEVTSSSEPQEVKVPLQSFMMSRLHHPQSPKTNLALFGPPSRRRSYVVRGAAKCHSCIRLKNSGPRHPQVSMTSKSYLQGLMMSRLYMFWVQTYHGCIFHGIQRR